MKAFDLGVQTHWCISITCDMCHKVHNLEVIIIGQTRSWRMTYCFLTNDNGFKVIPLIISFHSHASWYTSWSVKGKRRAKASFLVIKLEAYFINTVFSEVGLLIRNMLCRRMSVTAEKQKFSSLRYSALGIKDWDKQVTLLQRCSP